MDDAARLALYTKKIGLAPEQVQDFYPTPGTASTVMYYTGIDPFTGKKIYTATDYHEKQLQRALLQWRKPENRSKIYEAMDYCSDEGVEMLEELLGHSRGASRTHEQPRSAKPKTQTKPKTQSHNQPKTAQAKANSQAKAQKPEKKADRSTSDRKPEEKKQYGVPEGWARNSKKKTVKPGYKKYGKKPPNGSKNSGGKK
jgi:DNA-binding PadR family transcriptional regulator